MAGATYEHDLIAGNIGYCIRDQIRGHGCTVSTSDMRIHTPRTGLYTYPDAAVICGEPRFLDQKRTTLLNPTVIVEVLSPGTEAYDRGRRFEHYQSIESLREYLLVASDRISVFLYRRQPENEWLLITATTMESSIELESAGCRLLLRDLYENVSLAADSPGGTRIDQLTSQQPQGQLPRCQRPHKVEPAVAQVRVDVLRIG